MPDKRSRSPFPGMDPYLESRWSDVHVKMIGFMGEQLQPLLPAGLRARAEERVLLESGPDEGQGFSSAAYRSDVAVIESGAAARSVEARASGTATVQVAPIVIRRDAAPTVERWVQIIDASSGNRVITAIEILSPWNKASGRLNRQYLRKLDAYARAQVSVVEIDLLRYPPRGRLPVTENDIPADLRTAYMTRVRNGWEPDVWLAYPMSLRVALPGIPLPLRRSDSLIYLELQALIERVYAAGGHDDIDYSRPAVPPLSVEDAQWANSILTATRGTGSSN